MSDDLADALARAQAARRAADAYAAGFTPGQHATLVDLQAHYPTLGAAALPLAKAGVGADSTVALKAAEAKAQHESKTVAAGSHKSGGWLSSFGRTVGDALGSAIQTVVPAAGLLNGSQAKSLVRTGQAISQAPFEAVKWGIAGTAADMGIGDNNGGSGDSIGDLVKSTTIGAAATDPEGFSGSLGDGWLPDTKGRAAKRQAAGLRAANTIDGHAFTLGRGLASATPLEPGSLGYNTISGLTDFGAVFVLDPVGKLGGKAGEANRARQVFDRGDAVVTHVPTRTPRDPGIVPTFVTGKDGPVRVMVANETGMVDGVRQTVLPEHAAQWLHGPQANAISQHIADIKPSDPQAFTKIWLGTNKKLTPEQVLKMIDATDSVQVKGHIADAIDAGGMRDGLKFKPGKTPPARLSGLMPGHKVDLEDPEDGVEQAYRFMQNARFPADTISTHLEQLARAQSGGDRFEVIKSIMGITKESLVRNGFTEQEATRMTRFADDAREHNRVYSVNKTADGVVQEHVVAGGTGIELHGPLLSDELLSRYVQLPDPREIKNALRTYDWLREAQASPAYVKSATALDFINSSIFKPSALVTRVLAYPSRVLGEEQVRMSAAGFTSILNHPISYLAMLVADKPTVTVKGIDTATGEEVTHIIPNVMHEALKRRLGADNLGGSMVGRFEDEDLVNGLTDFQKALPGGAAVGWDGKTLPVQARNWGVFTKQEPEYIPGWHQELIQLASNPVAREIARSGVEKTKAMFWAGILQSERTKMASTMAKEGLDLSRRDHADGYIDAVFQRVAAKTGGDSELLDAVAHGRLRGTPLSVGLTPHRDVAKSLEQMRDLGPDVVKGKLTVNMKGSHGHQMLENWETGVGLAFNYLMTKPTNRLSRSKVFKQAYWQRVEESLPMMSGSERVRAVRAAKDAGIPKAQIGRMRDVVGRQTVDGKLTVEQVDVLAKAHGLDTTKGLLYDLHEKSQFFDAMRVVAPFGEAWKEMVTRWGKLAVDPRTANPNVLYRAGQGVQGAKESGFFYPDPTTGQEMFGLPGTEWLSDKLIGVPWKQQAAASGLSMFGQVIPGIGLVVAMPASKIIPDTPTYDELRNVLFPVGDPDTGNGILENLMPSYIQKLLAAAGQGSPKQKRMLAALTADTAAYLRSTGDYDVSDPAGQQRLLDDAKSKAKQLYVFRALMQASAPSSPRGQMAALDKDGRLHALYQLKDDYYKMLSADPQTATQRFLDKYGEFAFEATLGKTTTEGVSPTTPKANDLARSLPAQAKQFPKTIGLFADPETNPDAFSLSEEDRQIAGGTRKVASVEDIVKLANVRIANAIVQKARADGEDDDTVRALKEKLAVRYPGYTGAVDGLGKTPELVAELKRALTDKTLAGTDAGKGLALYLQARDNALASARAGGLAGFDKAAAAAPLRTWLRGIGDQIIQEHPGFQNMWDRVFTRELPED